MSLLKQCVSVILLFVTSNHISESCSMAELDNLECWEELAETLIPMVFKNLTKTSKGTLDPFHLETIHYEQDGINANFHDIKVFNISDAKMKNLKINFTEGYVTNEYDISQMVVDGQLQDGGHILQNPIQGPGNLTMKIRNLKINYYLKLAIKIMSGMKYMQFEEPNVAVDTESIEIHLSGLYNGDKNKTNELAAQLTGRSKSITQLMVKPLINELMNECLRMFNGFFSSIPQFAFLDK